MRLPHYNGSFVDRLITFSIALRPKTRSQTPADTRLEIFSIDFIEKLKIAVNFGHTQPTEL